LIGPEKAVRYYTRAGARARALCAYEKAVSELLSARSLLEGLPLDDARLAQLGAIVEQLAPAYRGMDRREEATGVLREYVALCEEHRYAPGIARGCTSLGMFLYFERPSGWLTTVQALYERAIAVCEAHGLHDWIVYPQARLAFVLAENGADLARAEEIIGACLPRAEAGQDTVLRQRLYTSLMWIAQRRSDWSSLREAFHRSLASGGPFTIPLNMILEETEGTCRRMGAEATFVELCHDIAAGYTRAGLEAPLQQWYLAPTTAQPTPGEPAVQEEFDGETWSPALTWQDTTGRSRTDSVKRPGWLGLHPAEGCDLWPDRDLNAPRLMAAGRGGFVAQTRVELGQEVEIFAGLLVWSDAQHFARLELRTTRAGRTAVYLQACVAGQFRSIGWGRCERQPIWLRVERVGDELRGLCSADGEQWLLCGTVRLPQGETEQVGLAAITKGPGGHAWFDTFLLWRGENL
jgi:regulation of enolase protein 1 (concanavalin A-like superfamily)